MTEAEIRNLLERQRSYFASGETLDIKKRVEALKTLKDCIVRHEKEIGAALRKDLGKSGAESYMCETGLVLSEISHMLRHIHSYTREKTVHTPLAQFHSRSYKKPSPRGVGPSGGRYRRRKYGGGETKCLFHKHLPPHKAHDLGVL